MAHALNHGHEPHRFAAPTVFNRAATVFRFWQGRIRDRNELAHWDERDFHDAGVTRSAIEYEMARPFWRG